MKKLYTQSKWKKYSQIRADNEKDKKNRTHEQGQGPNRRKRKNFQHNLIPKDYDHFETLIAPENFSLIENPEGVLYYLEQVRLQILRRNQVFLDKTQIKKLTPDALVLLVASLNNKWFTRGIRISGNAPEDEKLKELFLQSGFFEHVKSYIPKVKSRNLMLHRISKRKVKPSLVKEVCLIGVNHTFGSPNIFEPLYEMLIECMSNTNFHAGLEKQGKYEWWLYVYENPINKITSFSFLDLGVGIFESIPVKEYVKFMQRIKLRSNIDLVNDLVNGKIKSRTLATNRGKGIPQIFQHSKHKNIKNFKIISNNVFADFDTENYHKLKNPFRGTFLYWELSPDNI
ncbi:MAG TPA: hypothetical protein PKE69_00950 [Pyrinomonadaceae bacterium]|nr:hypothetical protein [Pyrinomonadaceae bacterium]